MNHPIAAMLTLPLLRVDLSPLTLALADGLDLGTVKSSSWKPENPGKWWPHLGQNLLQL
jgi:hypothetical protein